jgi:hypothetical protein
VRLLAQVKSWSKDSFRPHCRAGILPRGFLHRLWLIGVLRCCCYLWRLILGYLDLDQHPLDLLPLVPPDPGAFGWAVPSKLIEVSGWRKASSFCAYFSHSTLDLPCISLASVVLNIS